MRAQLLLVLLLGVLTAGRAPGAPTVAAKLQPFIDRHQIAGAVTLIGTKDQVLSVECVGDADLAARRPMSADTVFWIASMSKSVTGTAVMMLVSDGHLSVDDPIEKYLPEFANQLLADHQGALRKPAHPVTIRMLLTHTAGIAAHTAAEDHVDRLSLRDAVQSYSALPLRFEGRVRYEYSNAGINIAGRIVEVVSGLSFDEFLRQCLFEPLGMKDTTFRPNADQLKRLAKSYRPNADGTDLEEIPIEQLTSPLDDPHRGVSPAGGLFSTAHDMYLLGRMILNGGSYGGHRYLSPEAVAQMTSNQIGELPLGTDMNYGYGFGWIIHRTHPPSDPTGPGTYGAGGAYNTQMGIDPAHDLISVMMVQQSGCAEADRQRLRATFTQAAEDAVER
ncbi:MAG: serine hydrolase domain-containing protein [Opitutaceae bacterium]